MPYKTVLVHVDESAHASERIKIAAAIAMAENAHLIGTAMTGASRYLVQARMLAELDPNLRTHLDFLHARAMRGLDDFEATAQKLGLTSFEKRMVDDEAGGGICLQARYADLVVIGQNDPNELSPVVMPDFPEYVVLYSGRPVLLVPYSGHFEGIGKHVLVAWDASMPATRAVSSAIPLLRRAQTVQVVVFNPHVRPQAHGNVPGSDIALYLARHEVRVEVVQRSAEHDIGLALQALVSELQADLLVMGGYGHARFREILLGGVTSTVLETMRVPVLMAH
ncbi:universal stress protein [Noviherbaspirillum sp. UKPF54]|uniref:universal stress protein n=1 Tax=Noviherbaspirillum sp. UKPF54 TaxID=2601898 RepID=UPI0011B11616|nr:universal stress protein [Noviherbaspirillum sp. UKPF54]QDZ26917.1 universal stress protein [Noviherbaspirillum sp. UKPF54]